MTKYSGIWPVAPTPFNDDGTVDYEGMKRVIDCMVDQGSDGICILANFSEQFLITDEERRLLTEVSLKHMAGRLPVIVTISHYATQIAVARAQHAKAVGAVLQAGFAVASISVRPVRSLPCPHCAVSFMCEPQPVIIPRQ